MSADCSGELQCVASVCVDPTAPAGSAAPKGADPSVASAESKQKAAASDVLKVQGACEQYMLQKNNACPRSMTDLKAAGVVARVQKDPWGGEFVITCPGQHAPVDVTSYGPDST